VRIRRGPATVTGEQTLNRWSLSRERREGRGRATIREPGDSGRSAAVDAGVDTRGKDIRSMVLCPVGPERPEHGQVGR
jgi:hypothetical protein